MWIGEDNVNKASITCRQYRTRLLIGVLAGCLLAQIGCRDEDVRFVLEVGHLHFPDFQEVHRVGMGERFAIGDTELSARITRFEPDFAINTDAGKIFSRTQELNNPAVLVEVLQDGDTVAEKWAFRASMPHMGGETPVTFRLLSVEMGGVAADSLNSGVVLDGTGGGQS